MLLQDVTPSTESKFRISKEKLFVFQKGLSTFDSSSSYRAGSTDIPDPLSPLLPIVHRPR